MAKTISVKQLTAFIKEVALKNLKEAGEIPITWDLSKYSPAQQAKIHSGLSLTEPLPKASEKETLSLVTLLSSVLKGEMKLNKALAMFEAEGLVHRTFDWNKVQQDVKEILEFTIGPVSLKRAMSLLPNLVAQFQKYKV